MRLTVEGLAAVLVALVVIVVVSRHRRRARMLARYRRAQGKAA